MRAVARYSAWVERSPILAKSVTSATLTVTGDIIAQGIEGNFSAGGKGLDGMRLLRMGTWGFCIAGPLMHYWYDRCECTGGGGGYCVRVRLEGK